MNARKYALAAIAAGAMMFFSVIAINVAIDPQEVFGTGLLPPSANPNRYYRKVAAYEANSRQYDGLFFGSSRAFSMPIGELSRRMNVNFVDFHSDGGALSDYVPLTEYAIAQKAARGERLRAIFVLLDIDGFGLPPITNVALATLLPPPVTGMSPVRFWWKFLTTVQLLSWQNAIEDANRRWDSGEVEPPWLIGHVRKLLKQIRAELAGKAYANPAKPEENLFAFFNRVAAAAGEKPPVYITRREYFSADLQNLQRLVELCRQHNIELLVALTPLSRQIESFYVASDMDQAIARISQVTPLWDFARTSAITDRPGLWLEISHFKAEVSELMLKRIFREEMPPGWSDFGRHRMPGDAPSGPRQSTN